MAYKQSAGGPRQSKTGGSLPGQLTNAGPKQSGEKTPSYEDVIAGLGQKIKDKKTLVAKNKLEKKQNRVIDSMKTVISSGDRAAAKIYGNKDRGGKGLDTTNQGNWDERNAMDTRAKAHKKGV